MGLICTCVLDAYPKDENGNNIRPQIDTTIPSVQFVNDLKSGKVSKLAAQALQSNKLRITEMI